MISKSWSYFCVTREKNVQLTIFIKLTGREDAENSVLFISCESKNLHGRKKGFEIFHVIFRTTFTMTTLKS